MTRQPIVLVTESLRRSQGGAEVYMANFSEFLAREGHPVRVLARLDSQEKSQEGITVEIVPTWRKPALLREIQFARGVRRRITAKDSIVLSTIPLPGSITHYQPHAGLFRAAFAASGESIENGFKRKLHALGTRLNPGR